MLLKVRKRRKPTAVDLFAGAGGLSEGLRQAGFRVAAAVEIDAHACATYRQNHRGVRLLEKDITEVKAPELLRAARVKRGTLDLLAACPPCQGFSTMRTRNGAKGNRDVRNDLIFDVLRLVRSLRPVSVMLENVPGLGGNRRFKDFCSGLSKAGYIYEVRVLDTADYGVPQRRKRLVLLASRNGKPKFAPKSRRTRTVRETLSHVVAPASSNDAIHNYPRRYSENVMQLIRAIPKNGGSRSSLAVDQRLACHSGFDGFNDVYGRMRWNDVAPTITGGCINPSKGRFIHPTANRAITLREAALLQTFPRRYKFEWGTGRYAVALLIGNALPPEFIRRHASALKRSVLTKPTPGRYP